MRAYLLSIFLLVMVAFSLATTLEPWFQSWAGSRTQSDSMIQVALGDSRRMFARHFFTKADAYFHNGYYPTIYDSKEGFDKEHIAEDMHAEHSEEECAEDFLGKPKDWIDRFGRNFYPARHTHLGDAECGHSCCERAKDGKGHDENCEHKNHEGGHHDSHDGEEHAAESGLEREILPWLRLSHDTVAAARLVVASGGLSIPKIGASDFGYALARQFGHHVIEPRAGLVPLTFGADDWAPFSVLAGLSCEVGIEAGSGKGRIRFLEDLLFTHRGLSGPAVLQVSNYWLAGQPITIDLSPHLKLGNSLLHAKTTTQRHFGNVLSDHLPQRLVEAWLQALGVPANRPIPELRNRDLARVSESLARWQITPNGSEGWRKAEVTAGGVDL